ncbi:MAG: autotransporter-associated beta strand repeat-containing protein, partial [Candidatus Methylumidiphilus sp.]
MTQHTRLLRQSLALAVRLALLGAACPAGAAPTYVIADLGTLGGDASAAYAINDAGQVAGQASLANGVAHAFLWQNGTMQDLDTLGSAESAAFGLNAAGQAVGKAVSTSGAASAFSWQNGVMADIGGGLVATGSQANAVNAAGQTAGVGFSGVDSQAVLWQNAAAGGGAALPGGASGTAAGLNAVGAVVGSAGVGGGIIQAALWQADGGGGMGLTLLPGLASAANSAATAINAQGVAVGVAAVDASATANHAVRWENGDILDLGTLGGPDSQANAINANGQIVGQSHTVNNITASTDGHGFLWHKGGAITDINTLVSANPGQLTVTAAHGINALGQIAGTAVDAAGQTRAFLATPTGTLNWFGGSFGEWDTGAHWELGFTPNRLLDTTISGSAGSVEVVGPQDGATVKSLTVGGGSDNATLYLNGPKPLAADNGFNILTKGTVNLQKDGTIGAATRLGIDGGTLNMDDFNNSVAAVQLKSGQIHGSGTLTSAGDFDLQAGTVSASLAGGVGLKKTTAGTVALYGANTYTCPTTIAAGTLSLNGDGGISASAGVENNGHFDISGAGDKVSIAALTGAGSVNLGGQSLKISAASGRFSGVIAGNGGLTIAGGTQTLAGANTYSGLTAIDAGAALALQGGGGIASFDGVEAAGTFDISATAAGADIARLSGAGIVKLGARTLNLTAANGSFDGVISGSGGLTVAAGHQKLTGANTYAGQTVLGKNA